MYNKLYGQFEIFCMIISYQFYLHLRLQISNQINMNIQPNRKIIILFLVIPKNELCNFQNPCIGNPRVMAQWFNN